MKKSDNEVKEFLDKLKEQLTGTIAKVNSTVDQHARKSEYLLACKELIDRLKPVSSRISENNQTPREKAHALAGRQISVLDKKI